MIQIRHVLALVLTIAATTAGNAAPKAVLGENGLHVQEWFYDSSMNLSTDLQQAAAQGKGLIILYEQIGCIYCAELHAVNFARDEILNLINNSFLVIQLDLRGSHEVVDFDGEVLDESALATKWGVNFTPTTIVFSSTDPEPAAWHEAAAFTLPGYLKPFYYMTALDYFASGEIEKQGFKTFLASKTAELETQGIDPELW